MRKLFMGIGLLLVLLVAAVLILPSLVPASVYKDKITEQVKAALGRDVEIAGNVKLSVFPSLVAKADLVKIANADGFSNRDFATMDRLAAKVKLLPLFKKQVEITAFTLINPKISLEKAKNGRVNWAFGDTSSTPAQPAGKAFVRDGRYKDLQIALGTFSLENGSIAYTDAQLGSNYDIKAVNMKLSMPGLDQTVTAKGDLIINDILADIELNLDTPKAFLNGEAAPIIFKLKSDLITVSANGKFTPSKRITFDLDFAADIPSMSKLEASIPQSNPYALPIETAKIKGNLIFDGVNMAGKRTQVAMKNDFITTNFNGDFSAGSLPSAAGDLQINVANIQKLQTALEALGMAIPQLAAFTTADISTDLSTDGKTTSAKNLTVQIKGDGVSGNYIGEAKLGEDKNMSFNGRFDATGASVPAIVSKMGMQGLEAVSALKAVNALGNFRVSGNVSGAQDAVKFTGLDFKTDGERLTASYQGDASMGKTKTLNGSFDVKIASLKAAASASGIALPYGDILGALKASGSLKGSTDALTLSGVKAALTDGLLNLDFDGKVTRGKTLGYDGLVQLDIPSLRQLAAKTGTSLAPDTPAGQVYGPISISGSISGHAKGDTAKADFTNADIRFDDLQASGNFNADLTAKPMITGKLDMPGMDIRPYQAAMYANRPKGVQPWSEQPLNMSFLNLFDGDFTLNTPNIIMSNVEMGQSSLKATIKNGRLKTNIPNVSLYGGQGMLDMELNASGAVPQVAMDFTLNDVNGKGLLGAIANFTKLSGNTGTTMRIKGAGRSQAEIMGSLSGNGNFELAEGLISGVDLDQFVGGLNTAFQSRALPAGIGISHTTSFKKLAGLFSVKNGVVTIGEFSLNADTVFASGAGTLDLGQQRMDFSLRPRLKEGKGLAGFGIPIKFSGNFGGINASLDTDLMTKIMAARAKAELQSQITNKAGDNLGGIIGGLLGTPQSAQPAPEPTPQPAPEPAPKATQQDPDQQPSGQQPSGQTPQPAQVQQPADPIGGLLGDLLGGKKSEPAPQPEEDKKEEEKKEEKKQDDPLEKTLKSLFGND